MATSRSSENIDFFGGLYGVVGARREARRAWVLEMAGLEAARRSAGARAAARFQAAPGARLRGVPRAADPLSRRADLRRRPGVSPLLLGPDLHPRRRGHHRVRLHPLHGGGRVLSPPGADEPRAADRARHAARAARGAGATDPGDRAGRRAARRRGARGRAGGAAGRPLRPRPPRHPRRRRAGLRRRLARAPRGRRRRGAAIRPSRRRSRTSSSPWSPPPAGRSRGRGSGCAVRRLAAISRKEVLQLSRDPRSLALAFLLPVLLLVLFGYAISWDIRNIHTAVWDQDLSPASRSLLDAFRSSGYFIIDRAIAAARGDRAPPRPWQRSAGAGDPCPTSPSGWAMATPPCRRSSTARTPTPPPSSSLTAAPSSSAGPRSSPCRAAACGRRSSLPRASGTTRSCCRAT